MEEIHLFALAVVAGVIIYSDIYAIRYITGNVPLLARKRLEQEHRVVWAGLLVMIITGAILLVDEGLFLLADPFFMVKMLCVVALVVNALHIGTLIPWATEKMFTELPFTVQVRMLASGGISTVAWAGAAIIGLFFL